MGFEFYQPTNVVLSDGRKGVALSGSNTPTHTRVFDYSTGKVETWLNEAITPNGVTDVQPVYVVSTTPSIFGQVLGAVLLANLIIGVIVALVMAAVR
jgi:hypothetical protein